MAADRLRWEFAICHIHDIRRRRPRERLQTSAFTDIELEPERSTNRQVRSVAPFVSRSIDLSRRDRPLDWPFYVGITTGLGALAVPIAWRGFGAVQLIVALLLAGVSLGMFILGKARRAEGAAPAVGAHDARLDWPFFAGIGLSVVALVVVPLLIRPLSLLTVIVAIAVLVVAVAFFYLGKVRRRR